MSPASVQAAVREARRLIDRAEDVLRDYRRVDYMPNYKLTGALRRSSMELTRALADMRRPE